MSLSIGLTGGDEEHIACDHFTVILVHINIKSLGQLTGLHHKRVYTHSSKVSVMHNSN